MVHYYLHRLFRYNISYLRNYLHNYINFNFSLSPALFMVILIHMTLIRYIGSGPVWPIAYKALETSCRRNWWKSLLFLQNTQEFGEICVTQTWYLAVDTQLYVLAPLLYIPIRKWPRRTVIVMVILTFMSCLTGFAIAWHDETTACVTS